MILLTVGLIKKIWLYKISYFSEPYARGKSKIKAELDLSYYATKFDLKNAPGAEHQNLLKRLI